MKKIILLQNHPVFTLDISKIANPEKYELHLISTEICVEQLKHRDQHDFFESINVSNNFELLDLIGIVGAITNNKSVDFDIVTSSEQAMDICGKLRVYFNLDHDDLERYANKITMKKSLSKSDVRCPKYVKFDDAEFGINPVKYLENLSKEIPFPMFAKPINQAGSIGTALIKNHEELIEWCSGKDSEKSFEIDEYIEGTLFHCDAFIKNNEIFYTQVSMCLNPCFDFTLGKPVGSITLPADSEDFIRIKEFNENALRAMVMPTNAITHLEVIKKNDGELVFVEVAARPPASMVPRTYLKHLGVSIMEAHILLQIDDDYVPNINYGPYSAFVIYPKLKGQVSKFNEPVISSLFEVTHNVKLGDELTAAEKVRDIAAAILFSNENPDELMRDYLSLNHFNLYEVRAN
ncbi:MAG: hypothetical protein P4M12_02950 [Gammaproteobacteria bacterium]|nr:hypothetical protein [Gammaproteobacteria bacterium]